MRHISARSTSTPGTRGGRRRRADCGRSPRAPRPPLNRSGCHDAGWDQICWIHGFIGIIIRDSHSSAVRQPETRPGRSNGGLGTKGRQVDGAWLLLMESKWKLLKELFSRLCCFFSSCRLNALPSPPLSHPPVRSGALLLRQCLSPRQCRLRAAEGRETFH